MKKWDEENRQKIYKSKIVNAKSVLPPMKQQLKSIEQKKQLKELPTTAFSSAGSQRSGLSSNNNDEIKDLTSVPLYKHLKSRNLQQYANKLIQRGFGYDLNKFASMNAIDFNDLLDDLKVAPGHRVKLKELSESLLFCKLSAEQLPIASTNIFKLDPSLKFHQQQHKEKRRTVSPLKLASSPYFNGRVQPPAPVSTKASFQPKTKRTIMRVEKIGADFFHEDDYLKSLQALVKEFEIVKKEIPQPNKHSEFTPTIPPKIERKISRKKFTNNSNTTQNPLSQITSNTIMSLKRVSLQIPKQLKDHPKQPEHPIKKSNHVVKRAQDDIVLISEYKGDQIQTRFKDMKLYQNLQKLQGYEKPVTDTIQDLDKPSIQLDPIKQMYMSLDNIRMTSTLMNLDIEEMCNCLAWAIQKHIDFGQKQQFQRQSTQQSFRSIQATPLQSPTPVRKHQQEIQPECENEFIDDDDECTQPHIYDEDGNDITVTEYGDHKYPNPGENLDVISECTLEGSLPNQQYLPKIRREIDSGKDLDLNLKGKSVLHYYKQDKLNKHNQQNPLSNGFYEEPSESNIDYQDMVQYQEPIVTPTSKLEKSVYQNISMESKYIDQDEDEEEFLSREKLFQQTYDDNDPFQQSVLPTVEVICNYCKNILITTKMEKEVAIICLVYIERLLVMTGFYLLPNNWRKITLASLVIASKIWDDESFENNNFSKAFPQYTTQDINQLERVFLQSIDYNLYIKSSDYAKYYFILRTYAEKKKKSFPLRSLDVKTVLYLQKNSNKAEHILKEQYSNPINKSF